MGVGVGSQTARSSREERGNLDRVKLGRVGKRGSLGMAEGKTSTFHTPVGPHVGDEGIAVLRSSERIRDRAQEGGTRIHNLGSLGAKHDARGSARPAVLHFFLEDENKREKIVSAHQASKGR